MSDSGTLRIGVSRCLLGEKVRYDGTDRGDLVPFLRGAPRQSVEYLSVCPEVEAGMGIPREPVRLEGPAATPRMIAVDSRRDFTDVMLDLCASRIPELGELHGFVFKKGSPSCGIRDVKLFPADPEPGATFSAEGVGLFAAAVARAHPGIPLVDESDLPDPSAWARFLADAARFASRVKG